MFSLLPMVSLTFSVWALGLQLWLAQLCST